MCHGPNIGIATLVVTASLIVAASAVASDPKVPPRAAREGTRIVLVTSGIDYTRELIADHLARDGEGEPVAWDFVDGDRTPFAPDDRTTNGQSAGSATALTGSLLAEIAEAGVSSVLLAHVRVDPSDTLGLVKAIGFAARTGAPAALVAIHPRAPWERVSEALRQAPDLLIVLPDCRLPGEHGAAPDLAVATGNIIPAGSPDAPARAKDPAVATAIAAFARLVCARRP